MKGLTMDSLDDFHKEIMSQVEYFTPSPTLFRKLDEEWRSYLNATVSYYRWLAIAVKLLKPRRILELGSYTGGSMLCLLQELPPDSEIISVDLERDLRFIPSEVFDDPRIRFVFGNDLDLSIYGDNLPEDIDFLFIDTEHIYQQISREWSIYKYLLKNEAIVVIDDIRLNDMYKFWEELPYEKLEITRDCHDSGFGFFVFHVKFEESGQNLIKAYRASLKVMSSAAEV
ncbi:MAG: class I SAM-dependent methyltransferase [Actinomycetota bacterium]